MRKIHILAVAGVFAAGISGPVIAVDSDSPDSANRGGSTIGNAAEATGDTIKSGAEAVGHGVKSGAEAVGHGVKRGAQATGDALGITHHDNEVSAADVARYRHDRRGDHRMTGTITDIDSDGVVSLRTDDGTLKVPVSLSHLGKFKNGDKVTVELAFAKIGANDSEATRARAYDAPKSHMKKSDAMHWTTGTVSKVNRDTGMVDVKMVNTTATLHFPTAAVTDLNTGDRIAVQVALLSEGATHKKMHHRTHSDTRNQ